MLNELSPDDWRSLEVEQAKYDGVIPPPTSNRLKRRFRELGVAYIGGAENMTDGELNEAAANLHEWRDKCLVEGLPLYPANVCVKCLHPHLPLEHGAGCEL